MLNSILLNRILLKRVFFLALFFVLAISTQISFANDLTSKELSIIRITPSGDDVPTGHEISIQFNRPVVPIGRMERKPEEVPVTISPALECQWRWINTSTLTCQLGESAAFLPATRYNLEVGTGLKSADGGMLAEPYKHSFLTLRPQASYAWFALWKSPVEPQLTLALNQNVEIESVKQHVFFKEESERRVAVSVVAIEGSNGDRWSIAPVEPLTANSEVKLFVEPGLKSLSGQELGVEDRSIVQFATYPELRFVGIRCFKTRPGLVSATTASGYDSENGVGGYNLPFDILLDDPSTHNQKCNPMENISMLFSAPVKREDLQNFIKVEPPLGNKDKAADIWESVYSYVCETCEHVKNSLYEVSFPFGLQANVTYTIEADGVKIKDVFERSLSTPFSFSFLTDHRESRFHLNNQVSILEKGVDSHLPLVVTNLDTLNVKYDTLTSSGYQSERNISEDLYPARDIAYHFPVKVRNLLGSNSGVVQGNIQAASKDIKAGSWFHSQVTPFHVHAKLGHFNSLIWVTNFSDGAPVVGARVSLYEGNFKDIKLKNPKGNGAQTNKDGVAELAGLSSIDPTLDFINRWQHEKNRLFVEVQKGNDLAILPISSDFDASYDAYYPWSRPQYGHMKAWGTTGQGIYKLGDAIQYKILVRNQDIKSFVPAPKESYKLEVKDPTGKVVFERKDVQLSDFSGFDGVVEISPSWAVGWYDFALSASFTKETWTPLRVLVSDFTTAPFHVTTEVNKKFFSQGDKPEIATSALLHAGGPYVDSAVRVNALLSVSGLSFEDPKLAGFSFMPLDYESGRELYEEKGQTNSKGEFSVSFVIDGGTLSYGNITFESSVQDDRGKNIADSVSVPFFGRDRYIGIKQNDWVMEKGKDAELQYVVVDTEGKLTQGVPVKIDLEYRETKAARVKGAGNVYSMQYTEEWVPVSTCNQSSLSEVATCKFAIGKAGGYRFVAKIKDTKNREQASSIQSWAIGNDFVLWNSETGNSMQVTPEKNTYNPGDTARYLVKNPFPGAKALVSIERFGVIKHWMQELKDSSSIIEVPVTADLLPGFYLSVVVMSPRQEKPIENSVNLGKPSFKIGYAVTNVKDAVKELKINVKSEREEYRPREKVNVELTVLNKEDSNRDSEFAVAVLDESVFDLISSGISYFDPFKGFYDLDSLDLRNYNIIKQLVGRQKFEKKGANPGGSGGGDLDLRSSFKFVAYWNPSIRADKEGKAKISLDLPDNLTAWRVLALANTKTDQFGLGFAKFKVNQQTEVRAALPNQVMEGDDFSAKFTVMNRTESARTLNISITADGQVLGVPSHVQQLTLEPFKRGEVFLPVKAAKDGAISFKIRAEDSINADGLVVSVPVLKRAVTETAANYASTTDSKATEAISFPKDMRGDIGTIGVSLSPSVIGGIDEAFKYMKDYGYTCWEQQLSKALMALHYKNLKPYLPKDLSWSEADSIIASTLKNAELFQAPNGGMVFYIPNDQYASPYLSAYTALGFVWLKKSGVKVPEKVEASLHAYLLNFLKRDDYPSFYTRGLASSVRAVALAALTEEGKVGIDEVKRHLSNLVYMDLFAKAHLLMSTAKFDGVNDIQKQITDSILATANETGGKFVFSEEYDGLTSRIMASLPRSQCAVLSGLLSMHGKMSNANLPLVPDDIAFKVVRSITQYRMPKGHWENTQENIFCLNALTEYSKRYEKTKPDFVAKVILDAKELGSAKMNDFRNEEIKIERDLTPSDIARETTLNIEKTGPGRLYYSTKLNYALQSLRSESVNAGMDVRREYSVERDKKWVLLQSPMKISVGDLVKVDLFVFLPAARNFVVVDDAVPGGIEPVDRNLATTSEVDAKKGDYEFAKGSLWYGHDDWIPFKFMFWSFYHQEMRHHSVRFYSEYLPAGKYHLSYTAQAIAPGRFTVLPLKAQEMYDTDVYGLGVPAELEVVKVQ